MYTTYIQQINKTLPYSTGKFIQCFVIKYIGKELRKKFAGIYKNIYICIQPNHFIVYLELPQYFKSTILELKNKNVIDWKIRKIDASDKPMGQELRGKS